MERNEHLSGAHKPVGRWAPLALAALFAGAFYVVALTGPADDSDKDLTFFTTFEGLEADDVPVVLAAASVVEPVQVQATTEVVDEPDDVIRVPGDPATYELLNAWRRDDGLIEITTQRTLEESVSLTIRLVRCAPLELGVIAKDGSARNDSPEMERMPLGSAAAWMAAQACGAMK